MADKTTPVSNCVYVRDVAHLCRTPLTERPALPGVEPTRRRHFRARRAAGARPDRP